MAFRDDRDAQLARADALERENRELRDALAEQTAKAEASSKAAAANDAATRHAAKVADDERRAAAKLARVNSRLRDELAHTRPSWFRRTISAIARLRLAAPSGEGDYSSAALGTWRVYLPIVVGFGLPALIDRGIALTVWVGFVVGAPVVAAIAAAIPWLLNRTTRGTAGGAAGLGIGVAMLALLFVPNFATGVEMDRIRWQVLAIYTTIVSLHVTRATTFALVPPYLYLFAFIVLIPSPAALFVLLYCGFLGSTIASPTPAKH